MTVKILIGHALDRLRELPDESVQTWITSPPYWGLRDYDTEPLVYGGDAGCDHVWGDEQSFTRSNYNEGFNERWGNAAGDRKQEADIYQEVKQGSFCQLCNAWRGSLGLEPTPELYVAHLIEIFGEARRVLRKDGTLWLNLGDSYAAGTTSVRQLGDDLLGAHTAEARQLPRNGTPSGLKPKDLVGIPWRVAFALQEDGWWLRSACPWTKANAMPESVRDRPTTSHEYWFLLTRSERYFWDQEAVRIPLKDVSIQRITQSTFDRQNGGDKDYGSKGVNVNRSARRTLENLKERYAAQIVWSDGHEGWAKRDKTIGRNRRTSDFFFESLDATIREYESYLAHLRHVRDNGGLLLDEEGGPLALNVPTRGYKGAHFATFPADLIEPLIKASTSEKGRCSECGSPWERLIEATGHQNKREDAHVPNNTPSKVDSTGWAPTTRATDIWQPTCDCPPHDPVPCMVGDMFGGAGTVGLVADRLGRDAVLIELNEAYAEMSRRRIAEDAGPMLLDLEVIESSEPIEPEQLEMFA